mgnify:CR=1|jgi:hypothetical protein
MQHYKKEDMTTPKSIRAEVLRVRVRAEEMATLKRMAEESDTTVSDYVRRSLKHQITITTQILK